MIVRTVLNEGDNTVTVEFEEGDDIPEEDDIIVIEGEGIRLGRTLFDKYGVRTYEILEWGLDDPYPD